MDDSGAAAVTEQGRTVRFVGGPADWAGREVPGMDAAEAEPGDDGGYMVVAGQALRAHYAPRPGEDPDTWVFQGMVDV